MKKKTLVVVGALVIAAVIGTVLFFILHGDEEQHSDAFAISGTWLIIQHGEECPRNEFMVFTDTNVSFYRNASSTPAATSAYSIKGNKLNTPDIDKEFNIRVVSEHNIVLIESNTVVWRLLLVGNSNADMNRIVPERVEGIYDVLIVGEEHRQNEQITFTDTHMSLVQDGKETISSDYLITDEGFLRLTTINRDFFVYADDAVLLFVNPDDNCVWELKKAQ